MFKITRIVGLVLMVILLIPGAYSQQPEKKGFLRSTITLEGLKKAVTVEELLVNFPIDYEVVSCRISIAGKDLKNLDNWKPDYKKNVLNNTFQSVEPDKVYVEYIEVKRKGSDSKLVRLQPREIVVLY